MNEGIHSGHGHGMVNYITQLSGVSKQRDCYRIGNSVPRCLLHTSFNLLSAKWVWSIELVKPLLLEQNRYLFQQNSPSNPLKKVLSPYIAYTHPKLLTNMPNTTIIGKLHCHTHMEIRISQDKKLGLMPDNVHYCATGHIPLKGTEKRLQGCADALMVVVDSQGNPTQIVRTIKHKCIQYNNYIKQGPGESPVFNSKLLLKSLQYYNNKYKTVDMVVIHCVNPLTYAHIKQLLVENPHMASKIVPNDISY